jgi:hypothetical protein
MYLGVVLIFAMILVLLSPAIWIAWWLLAGLGSRAKDSYGDVHESFEHSYRRAA